MVIIPVWKKDEERSRTTEKAHVLSQMLRRKARVKVDDDPHHRPGWKFNEWELRGVPVRLVVGPRDLEAGTVEVAFRHTGEKRAVAEGELLTEILSWLEGIQQGCTNGLRPA